MENSQNTQRTVTSANVQQLSNACVQWRTYASTKFDSEAFFFPDSFDTENIAVILNRTVSNADDTLPCEVVNSSKFKVNRADTIDGNDQTFNMLAVGAVSSTPDQNYCEITDSNGRLALIQWGAGQTDKDGDQEFAFPIAFNTSCKAVVTNRTEPNAHTNLPVPEVTSDNFTINRPNTINGAQKFYWIAIGDCRTGNHPSTFSFLMEEGGKVMKGGYATSSSDSAQTFSFEDMGIGNFASDCYTVVTTRTNSGCEDILPVTNMSKTGFTIDRSSGLVGKEGFYWLAVGE